MQNVILLMKLDMILHGKSFWRMKWQFLFFVLIFSGAVLMAVHQPPKLFYINYYNEDTSYASRLAIDNFISALKGIAEIREVKNIPENPSGDALVIFPAGFAEKWQHFQSFPARIYILTKNPIYQALLIESFQAYESIMMASESVISAYNEELDYLQLPSEQWINANVQISLDFLAMAFNRQQFFDVKNLEALPAALTKSYFYFSFSLFGGLFLSIYWSSAEIERRRRYRRIFLSRITSWQYLIANLFLTILLVCIYVLVLLGIANIMGLSFDYGYFPGLALVLLVINLILRILTVFFQSEIDYSTIGVAILFVFALFGGVFLPISFLPSAWIEVVHLTPFYQLFLFLTKQAVTGLNLSVMIIWLVSALPLVLGNWLLIRRRRYA
ncbi:ABC transporter permease [Clostridiales bacterium COT073_COT-073]|nr:ABC transporter permease [Clostridiales bacterium COT073_COT-073]